MLSATKEQLIARIHAASDPIQSFYMKANLSPSAGSFYGGQVTDYATIGAEVWFRRPEDIRIVGLDPVVHTTIFAMVSTGGQFRVYIPSKNSFIEGENNARPISRNPLENLRPQAFLDSLIVSPPGPEDVVLFEDEPDRALYTLLMIRKDEGTLRLDRSLAFDRYTLDLAEQKTFDSAGEVVSLTRYFNWKPRDGVSYPAGINIRRPKDGYEVDISAIKMTINPPDVTSNKFVLNQPPNAEVRVLK